MSNTQSNHLFNQSSEKAFSILEYIIESKTPVRLTDVSQNLKMNVSTASRFLNSLQKSGYIQQDASSMMYHATYKVCRLANQVISKNELSLISHPYLLEIADYFDESACISIERDMQMVYIDVASNNNRMLMGQQYIGNSIDMHITANGKLLLSQYSEKEIDNYIEKKGLKKYTPNTLTTKEALLNDLTQIAKTGYSFDNEECEIGASCISFPIFDYSGKMIAGVCITGPSYRVNPKILEDRLEFLREKSMRISMALGYYQDSPQPVS